MPLQVLDKNGLMRDISQYFLVTVPRGTVTVMSTSGFTVLITAVLVAFLRVT